MQITVRTLRMGWSAVVEVPAKCLVGELRQEAAKAAGIPAARAKLVLRGAALQVSSRRHGAWGWGRVDAGKWGSGVAGRPGDAGPPRRAVRRANSCPCALVASDGPARWRRKQRQRLFIFFICLPPSLRSPNVQNGADLTFPSAAPNTTGRQASGAPQARRHSAGRLRTRGKARRVIVSALSRRSRHRCVVVYCPARRCISYARA
jgi:hypothetical protein